MKILGKFARKMLSFAVIAAMLMAMLPVSAFAAAPSDIANHWAKAQITDWVEKGLIKGYPDGTFKPDKNITRAEFMVLVNGAFGYTDKADINFKDVPSDAWYADTVAKAKAAGYISGYEDGTIRPDQPITRAEAATIIMKIKGLAADADTAGKFADAAEIPAWSKGTVGAVAAAKVMNGYPDGSFKAGNPITRAEAMVALDKALNLSLAVTYDKVGTYGPAEGTETVNGNVVIKAQDVTLQNTIIEGDLTIDKAVGEGDVTLKNVTVKGTAYINGGGANSVHLIDTNLNKAVVQKANGTVRLVASGNAEVGQLVAQSSIKVEETNLSGKGFTDVVVEKKVEGKLEVILVGAKLENIEVKNQEVTLSADKNTEIKILEVKADNVTVTTEKGTTITTLVADGKVSVTGQGTIQKAEVNVSGVSFETKPQGLDVATGVTPPTVGTGTTGGSSGGGGGGGSTPTKYAVTVADVVGGTASVTVDKTTAAAGELVTITIANIESGKQFKSITVVDADNQAVATTEVTAGAKYTFTMPAKAVTVTVEVEAEKPIAATWEATEQVGVHEGKIYQEYAMKDASGNLVDLSSSNVTSVSVLEPGATEGKALTPDTDTTLWFNVQKASGEYKYTVVDKAGKTYKATLTWAGAQEVTAQATGQQGWHEGKQYAEYKLGNLDLSSFDAMYEIKPDGSVVALEANTDTNLWFNLSNEDGTYTFLVKKAGVWYKAVIEYTLSVQSTYKLTYSGLAESYTAGSLVDVNGKTQTEINNAVEAAINKLTPINVTLATDVLGQNGYEAVRIAPVSAGSNVQLWAKDANNNWYDINVVGWGPAEGFALPAQYDVTTPVYFLSDKAGDYTLNVKLVDVKNNNAEVASASANVTVNPATVAVTGVSLDKSTLTLTVGGTDTLVATVEPADATNKNVTWSSSDEEVATVTDGVVTAVGAGTATITVTTVEGGFTATCYVTVNPAINEYLMFNGVTTRDASDDTPITDKSLTVTANGDTLTLTGSVNKSTAWFGPGTWNYYWVTLGIKIPDGITPIQNENGCYENLNVFTLKNRGNGDVWENSGTYEPVITVDGKEYMQFSFALDSVSTVLDPQGRMHLKVVFGGNYSYSGGEPEQIPEGSFNIPGAQTLYVDYSNVVLSEDPINR